MPIDLRSLKKLETLPGSAATEAAEGRMTIIVRLHPGAERPDWIEPRALVGDDMFTAEVDATELERIEADPAIAAVALSRNLPMVE